MFSHTKHKSSFCNVCNVILGILAIIASVAALVGVYKAHVLSTGLVFGTTSGSMSLIALAINLFLLTKLGMACTCAVKGKK